MRCPCGCHSTMDGLTNSTQFPVLSIPDRDPGDEQPYANSYTEALAFAQNERRVAWCRTNRWWVVESS